MITPEAYLGIPWVKGGNTRVGVDCWGLTVMGLREMYGVKLKIYEGSKADGRDLANIITQETAGQDFTKISRPKGGDIVTMSDEFPSHIGLCVGAGHILHTMEGRGVDITPIRALERIFRKVEFYRYVGDNNSSK
jgi:cell wall-associated NlpC family hydrolase